MAYVALRIFLHHPHVFLASTLAQCEQLVPLYTYFLHTRILKGCKPRRIGVEPKYS